MCCPLCWPAGRPTSYSYVLPGTCSCGFGNSSLSGRKQTPPENDLGVKVACPGEKDRCIGPHVAEIIQADSSLGSDPHDVHRQRKPPAWMKWPRGRHVSLHSFIFLGGVQQFLLPREIFGTGSRNCWTPPRNKIGRAHV